MGMEVFSFSCAIGESKCNCACPGCVARMTAPPPPCKSPSYRNLKKGCQMALVGNASTILFTGKGEPTLYPDLMTEHLEVLNWMAPYLGAASFFKPPQWLLNLYELISRRKRQTFDKLPFPFADLQTNGIELMNMERELKHWYKLGLSLVCLSISHWEDKENTQLMRANKQMNIFDTVGYLHDLGYAVRINVTAQKGGVENLDHVEHMVELCKKHKVEQLTIRDLTTPDDDETFNPRVTKWVKEHQVNIDEPLRKHLEGHPLAKPFRQLSHGATVFDYKGQNLTANNCLTTSQKPDEIRQLIYINGRLTTDWKYVGAILL